MQLILVKPILSKITQAIPLLYYWCYAPQACMHSCISCWIECHTQKISETWWCSLLMHPLWAKQHPLMTYNIVQATINPMLASTPFHRSSYSILLWFFLRHDHQEFLDEYVKRIWNELMTANHNLKHRLRFKLRVQFSAYRVMEY